jgi:hypothetical protein
MHDPVLDRHEWESERQALEQDLRADPANALPQLDRLVSRMLEESGYELTGLVVGEGEEREVMSAYISAHDIAVAVEVDPEGLSPGDVASAIDGYRAVFDHLAATRAEEL